MSGLLFLKSLAIGVVIAAPVGPVAVLCFRRAVQHGWTSALAAGMGAAVADTVFAAIAVFGLAATVAGWAEQDARLPLACGAILIAIGLFLTLKRPSEIKRVEGGGLALHRMIGDWLASFLVTMTNPFPILSFIAIFGALGIAAGVENDARSAVILSGVFLGATLWWAAFSAAATRLVGLNLASDRWVNRCSGVALVGFGMVALLG